MLLLAESKLNESGKTGRGLGFAGQVGSTALRAGGAAKLDPREHGVRGPFGKLMKTAGELLRTISASTVAWSPDISKGMHHMFLYPWSCLRLVHENPGRNLQQDLVQAFFLLQMTQLCRFWGSQGPQYLG